LKAEIEVIIHQLRFYFASAFRKQGTKLALELILGFIVLSSGISSSKAYIQLNKSNAQQNHGQSDLAALLSASRLAKSVSQPGTPLFDKELRLLLNAPVGDPRLVNDKRYLHNEAVMLSNLSDMRMALALRRFIINPTDDSPPPSAQGDTLDRERIFTKFPEVVAIRGAGEICTGVLVPGSKVLTAGHCLCDGTADTIILGADKNDMLFTLPVDKSHSSTMLDCSAYEQALAAHDIAAQDRLLMQGDVAVLSYVGTSPIAASSYAASSWIDSAVAITTVGYGETIDSQASSLGKRGWANILVQSHSCTGSQDGIGDAEKYGCKPGQELIAAETFSAKATDTCYGDSGAGAFVTGSDGRFYLGAIASRRLTVVSPNGLTTVTKCGHGSIFERLDSPSIARWLGITPAVALINSGHNSSNATDLDQSAEHN
jgi:hypothetical protein